MRHPQHQGPGERPSPSERFLRDPSAALDRALQSARDVLLDLSHALPKIAAVMLVLVVARIALARLRERRLADGARLVSIGVPPEVKTEDALLLWSSLHDLIRPRIARLLHGQPHLVWEIAAGDAGTSFRLWIPRQIPPGLVERALTAAWPGASVTASEAPADETVPTGSERATVELVLSGPEWFPLGGTDGPDPVKLLLGQLATPDGDEGALVQILARPATARERRQLVAAARNLRAGRQARRFPRLLDFALNRSAPGPALDPTVNPDVRAVMEKAAHPLYRCLVRITVSAPSRPIARGRIHAIAGALAAYEGRVGLRRRRAFAAERNLRMRALGRRSFLLSVPELAALAHLPAEEALPGVLRAGARSVAPPPALPAEGKPLGVATTSGRGVMLAVPDARHHLHLLGPTGVGKSTLIARLALADLGAARGAVVVDPKGDLVEDILARVPAGAQGRVDLLDPLDSAPPGLNVLEGTDRDLVVDQLVGVFHRVYERFWGPRTDDILRAALLTLTGAGQGMTLAEVPRLLTDDAWREELLVELDDPVGLEPFWDWYDELSEATRAQATGPVLNKLRAFLLRRPVRAIVGQPQSTIDVARCLDSGRLLLVRVPKGTLGEDTSRLLGSFVVARVWQAALARADRPEDERPDCALYVDEVHNYLNLPTPLEDVLAEARGYRLSLCLAHQHLAQLDRDLRAAITANARTKVYFQVSPEDASALEREVRPELAAHDLAHLPRYTAAVRICQAGETGRAFTLATEALEPGDSDRAANLRADSRRRIGTARERVEAQLAKRQTSAIR
jgi:hypothetical protein